MKNNLLAGGTQCILCFTFCSFIGWLYEIAAGFLIWGEYADRGMLRLPLCPIYGFGALLLVAVFRGKNNVLTIAVSGAVVCTILELAVSYTAERMLGSQLWTYEHWPLDFQGRISLISSLIFGVFSVIAARGVWPAAGKLARKMPAPGSVLLDALLVGIIGADTIISLTAIYKKI